MPRFFFSGPLIADFPAPFGRFCAYDPAIRPAGGPFRPRGISRAGKIAKLSARPRLGCAAYHTRSGEHKAPARRLSAATNAGLSRHQRNFNINQPAFPVVSANQKQLNYAQPTPKAANIPPAPFKLISTKALMLGGSLAHR